MNPIQSTKYLTADSLINSHDAVYVQMIYTTSIPDAHAANSSILIRHSCDGNYGELANRLLEQIAVRNLTVIASETEIPRYIKNQLVIAPQKEGKIFAGRQQIMAGKHECLIGIYSNGDPKEGQFQITVDMEYCELLGKSQNFLSKTFSSIL